MMSDDVQLMRQYAAGSEDAFSEVVARYTDLVYSAALRRSGGDPHLAKDITQMVFTALAGKARSLPSDVVLAGWLHCATRYAAGQLHRSERRRQAREQEAALMSSLDSVPTSDWEQIHPLLDLALDQLRRSERDALLLRFFERRSLAEIGRALGLTEEAARKRVARSLEKVRSFLARRGVTTTASLLSLAVSANAVQPAPVGLAAAASAAALTGAAAGAGSALSVLAAKAIVMTTIQKVFIGTALIAGLGFGIYEAHRASNLRTQVQMLQQQRAPLTARIRQLERERNDSARRLALLADEMERSKGNSIELLRLRGEVSRLRSESKELARLKAADTQASDDPLDAASKDLRAKVNLLKQRLDQRPQTKIPELQYLSAADWLRIVQAAYLRADNPIEAQVLTALSHLRCEAKQQFAEQIGEALRAYAQANGGQLPADVSQLKPYFSSPVEDATLQRYQMLKTGNVNALQPKELVVAEKAPVDEYDTLWQIGLWNYQWQGTGRSTGEHGDGTWSKNTGPTAADLAASNDPDLIATVQTLMPAMKAFAAANGGREPAEPMQLRSYLTTPEQQAALQKLEAIAAATNALQR